MIDNFTNLHYILSLVLIGYGIVYGFRNTMIRLYAIVSFRGSHQNVTGHLMDATFYAGIGYLVLVYTGVIV